MTKAKGVARLLSRRSMIIKPSKPWLVETVIPRYSQGSSNIQPDPIQDGKISNQGLEPNLPTSSLVSTPPDKYLEGLTMMLQKQKYDDIRRIKELVGSIDEARRNSEAQRPSETQKDNGARGTDEPFKSTGDGKLDTAQQIIGYMFSNPELLREALRISGSSEKFSSNKRLAFTGDAIIRLALADDWYATMDARGVIDRSVAVIGSNENLAAVGRRLGLDACVSYNPNSPCQISDKMMGDTMEAILAAVYFDTLSGDRMENVGKVMRILGLLGKPITDKQKDSVALKVLGTI